MDFLNAELCAAKAAEAELDHELHLTIQQYSKVTFPLMCLL